LFSGDDDDFAADVAKTRRPNAGQVVHHIFAPLASVLAVVYFFFSARWVETTEKKQKRSVGKTAGEDQNL